MKQSPLVTEKEIIETSIQTSLDIVDKSHFINQIAFLKVLKREYTGVGFFTDFIITKGDTFRIDGYDLMIGVSADLKGIKYGADFIVYIKDGLIDSLEGVCFAEKWPDKFLIEKIL